MNSSPQPVPPRYRVLDLEIDLGRQSVWRGRQELALPDLSFRLLAALVRSAPDRVDKDDLIRDIWDDVVVSDETLAQRVRLLRQALGDNGKNSRYIASVRGRGYRLICPAEVLTDGVSGLPTTKRWSTIIAIVVLVVVGTWFATTRERNIPSTVDTIAVLPFTDLSADQSNEHFANGVQEELLSRLTGVGGLHVVSRTSVEQYRSTELTVPVIARQLGADAIIEGSIRIAGNRVRITVQLIEANSDRHLWAENFDRELTVANLFMIQEDVADKIARALQLQYEDELPADAKRLPTYSIEAYNAFLLGRYYTFRQTARNLDIAVTWLERAIAIDPEFEQAYATLGWAQSFRGTAYGRQPPGEVFPKAKEAALRALALDSESADARTLYADILAWYDWDFEAAEREYRNTIEIEPSNVLGYALFLSTQSRHEEAIALIETRIAMEPNDPYVWVNAAWRYLNAGQLEKAIAAALRAEDHPDAKSALGSSYLAAGDIEHAISIFESDLDLQGSNPTQLSNLATAYFKANRRNDGQQVLDELESQSSDRYVSPALLASVYFASGDTDTGFDLMGQAVTKRAREVIFLQVSQMLAGHRDDPRYLALIRRVGFK